MQVGKFKFWTKKEINLLKKLYPTTLVRDLIKFFPDRNKATLVAKARSLGLPSAKLWQKKEDKVLKKYFYKTRKKKLLKLLPRRSWLGILARGERLGLKRKLDKPTLGVDEDYFKKWTPNMAYILGFILADGSIVKSKRKGHSDSLKFGVHFRDIDILKKIKKDLKSKHKISETGNAAHLSIASQVIVDDLKKLGITYRKSLSENVPKVPEIFIKDLVRGFVDGDGSIKIDKTGYPNLAVYGGREIIKFIRNHFLDEFDIYSGMLKRTRSKEGKYLYQISYRCNSAKVLLDYLYSGANLSLDRKLKLVKKCLNINMKFKKNYTKKELAIIKDYYSIKPKEELFNMLPNRKWIDIQAKAWKIGIYKNKRRRDAAAGG